MDAVDIVQMLARKHVTWEETVIQAHELRGHHDPVRLGPDHVHWVALHLAHGLPRVVGILSGNIGLMVNCMRFCEYTLLEGNSFK